jgi:hypothetical protein
VIKADAKSIGYASPLPEDALWTALCFNAQAAFRKAEKEYKDCDARVFTPSSFALLSYELSAPGTLAVTPLTIVYGPDRDIFMHMMSSKNRDRIDDFDQLGLLKSCARGSAVSCAELI